MAAAVTIGVSAAIIGSTVASIPPSCVSTVVNNVAYQHCGGTWYQPVYSGTTVQFVVVAAPR
ncbi:hypothetical protein [Pandoraea fibrosis]|uniref:Uncharacterized protein n=1 Tax=Pandoraea fibrosis TaxID=1891094 RepID=A0ABX6HTR3_9BURK|nr:hypothetical protein [Pandoraea fibrosis]QHE92491.1 hypothetical protein PJ20_012130 [Pandoraea fibrosis]QHF13952.1 hypothetical protein PI93_015870 [Pandoraea fibrosis]